jgi:hypothetical protein
MRRAGDGEGDQPLEAANAMFFMHDQLAFGEIGGFGKEDVGAFFAAAAAGEAFTQHILLAQQQDFAGFEAVFQRQYGKADGFAAHVFRVFPRGDAHAVKPAFHEDGLQAFAGAFGVAGQQGGFAPGSGTFGAFF